MVVPGLQPDPGSPLPAVVGCRPGRTPVTHSHCVPLMRGEGAVKGTVGWSLMVERGGSGLLNPCYYEC